MKRGLLLLSCPAGVDRIGPGHAEGNTRKAREARDLAGSMKMFSEQTLPRADARDGSRWKRPVLAVAMMAAIGLTGCETPGQSALAGAAAGAAIGGAIHGRGEDALKGAAIGAGAGYLAGRAVRHERERAYREGYYDSRYDDGYRGRRLYADRYGQRYFIGNDGRRHYVD